MATFHDASLEVDGVNGVQVVHLKGAIDRLLPLCNTQACDGKVNQVEPVNRDYWLNQADEMSSHGLRVLALCRGTLPAGTVKADDKLESKFITGGDIKFTVVGLCCILDPPRPECISAIKEAHGAGVRVAMITGDHKATAVAIGKMLGIIDKKTH